MSKLNENIKKYRNFRKITQQEIAEKLNKSKGVISNWERGDNSPSPDEVELLCKIFNITPNQIYGWEDNPEYLEYLKFMERNEDEINKLKAKQAKLQNELSDIQRQIAKRTQFYENNLGEENQNTTTLGA